MITASCGRACLLKHSNLDKPQLFGRAIPFIVWSFNSVSAMTLFQPPWLSATLLFTLYMATY